MEDVQCSVVDGICRWKFQVEFLYIYYIQPGPVAKNATVGPLPEIELTVLHAIMVQYLGP